MARMHSTNHFGRGRRSRLDLISSKMLFTYLMLISGILYFTDQSLANTLYYGFVNMFSLPLQLGGSFTMSSPVTQTLPALNTDEMSEQNNLVNMEQQLKEVREQLDFITGIKNNLPLENAILAPAGIIKKTINDTEATLVINKGSNQGLKKGQFVLAYNSIIGRISDVTPYNAEVRLFTDINSIISVQIDDIEILSVMQGNGGISATIKLVSIMHSVKVGQQVLACKETGLLDSAMIIGVISNCKPDLKQPLVWDITVEPVCNITDIDEIAVLVNPSD